MSHTTCQRCGQRYRDEHDCPQDVEAVLDRVAELENELESMKEQLKVAGDSARRRVAQIATAVSREGQERLYALDSLGEMWLWRDSSHTHFGGWVKMVAPWDCPPVERKTEP